MSVIRRFFAAPARGLSYGFGRFMRSAAHRGGLVQEFKTMQEASTSEIAARLVYMQLGRNVTPGELGTGLSELGSEAVGKPAVVQTGPNEWLRVDGLDLIPFDVVNFPVLLQNVPNLGWLRILRQTMRPEEFDRICLFGLTDPAAIGVLLRAWSTGTSAISVINDNAQISSVLNRAAQGYGMAGRLHTVPSPEAWLGEIGRLQADNPYRAKRALLVCEYGSIDELVGLLAKLSMTRLYSHSVLYLPRPDLHLRQLTDGSSTFNQLAHWAERESLIIAGFDAPQARWRHLHADGYRPSAFTALFEAPVEYLEPTGIKL